MCNVQMPPQSSVHSVAQASVSQAAASATASATSTPASTPSPTKKKTSPQDAAVAAAMASTLNVLATMPVDTVMKWMQANSVRSFGAALWQALKTPEGSYRPAKLYRGLPAAVTTAGIARSLTFGGIAAIRPYLPAGMSATQEEAVAALVFACARSPATSPFDRCKTEMQVGGTKGSLFDTAKNIIRKEGASGLWQGMSTDMMRNALRLPIFMGLRTFLKEQASEYNVSEYVGKEATNFAVGAVAGGVSEAFSYPAFVLKTQMQKLEKKGLDVPKGLGMNWRMASALFAQKGVAAFYSGLGVRIGGMVFGSALYNVFSEASLEIVQGRSRG